MDEHERLRRQFARPGPEQGPGPDCPSVDLLTDAIAGDLMAREAREVADHAATCAWCGFQWQQMKGGETVAAPVQDGGRSRMGLWIMVSLAMIAAAMMLSHFFAPQVALHVEPAAPAEAH